MRRIALMRANQLRRTADIWERHPYRTLVMYGVLQAAFIAARRWQLKQAVAKATAENTQTNDIDEFFTKFRTETTLS